ncbi:hypothetical protein SAE02_67880 [Skermanella aerolata]|uniref:Uncharacterized protein n=1 Tax=Skermanella aerolata TaxID=393310 RepID=A0A512E2E8_9PROT|nr:hypothetical protein N826_31780 [Skermanella aerolata KACC 11604]GEO42640.1 hypothetical protein SAE02_67880 [Skermanella aerolata]
MAILAGPSQAMSSLMIMRKAITALWYVAFCGMQWRAIDQLCDIPFGTL